jgi:hypothetical protein
VALQADRLLIGVLQLQKIVKISRYSSYYCLFLAIENHICTRGIALRGFAIGWHTAALLFAFHLATGGKAETHLVFYYTTFRISENT